MSKQVLIETGFITDLRISNELKESISLSAGKGNTLVVKNVPCTILNRKNQNGRIYSTKEVQTAIDNAREQIRTKQLLSQADEHPEGSYVAPTHASHVVTRAYIKKNVDVVVEDVRGKHDVLFMDWEVLDTVEGNNLKALLKAECSLGTSIRGLGDMQGDQVINYELLGVDVVSNPSSGTFTRMPIRESIVVETKEAQMDNSLNEAFEIDAETIDTVRDTAAAAELLHALDQPDSVATMSKANVKFDTEINPQTGAETTVTILTTDTHDEVSDLNQALALAGKKMSSDVGTTDSVTITRIDDEELVDESALDETILKEDEADKAKEEVINALQELINHYNNLIENPENQPVVDLINDAFKQASLEGETIDQVLNKVITTVQDLVNESTDEVVTTNGNTVSMELSDGNVIEKDYDSEEEANVVANGINNGNLDPETLTDSIEEKIYEEPDAPSDDLVPALTLDEEDSELKLYKIVATDLDFNIDPSEADSMSIEDLELIKDKLPERLEVEVELPEHLKDDKETLIAVVSEKEFPINDASFEVTEVATEGILSRFKNMFASDLDNPSGKFILVADRDMGYYTDRGTLSHNIYDAEVFTSEEDARDASLAWTMAPRPERKKDADPASVVRVWGINVVPLEKAIASLQ